MSWQYKISTGELFFHDGALADTGWSGIGEGFNNPAYQDKPHTGPIPKGLYIIDWAYLHPSLGPLVMNLIPHPNNIMYLRSLFRFHGYSKDNPATQVNETLLSSHGCIIMVHEIRTLLMKSMDRLLEVVE